MALHSTLTDSELHENKGVSSAADDTVATADTNATVWKKITTDNLDTSNIFGTNTGFRDTFFTDVSTAEKVYIYFPFNATITEIKTVLQNAISVADATVTAKNAAGTSMGTITIAQSGSAAGDIDTLTPSSNNTVTSGNWITIETDGASTTASKLFITVSYTRTS